jgi:hypothetical protein
MSKAQLPPLARLEAATFRDDRLFIVATEDKYASKQYFEALRLSRVKLLLLETDDCNSSPQAVVDRIKKVRESRKSKISEDQFWIVLDTDHWTSGNHAEGTIRAMNDARQCGISIAFSNPCFEFWLLLHHLAEPPQGDAHSTCEHSAQALRDLLGSYNKTKINAAIYKLGMIRLALSHAETLDIGGGYWPSQNGSHVYKLIKELLPSMLRFAGEF